MLIPYRTDRELQRIPYATITLIGLNVGVAVFSFGDFEVTLTLALNPEHFGWWQPLTAMFTHAGFMHLATNMLFLWLFGSHVEDTVGAVRFLLLYFSAGFAADVLQVGWDLATIHALRGGLGASGAIMGLVALFATRFRKVNVHIFYWYYFYFGTWEIRAIWIAALYVGMDLVIGGVTGLMGVPSMVGNFAHIGGFLCGLVWAYALALPHEAAADEARDTAAGFAAAGALGAAGAAVETQLRRDPQNPELHRLAATYLFEKLATRERAIGHANEALRLWLRSDQTEAALEYWRKLQREIRPSALDPGLLHDIGVILEERGLYEEAATAYVAVASDHVADRRAPRVTLRLANMVANSGQAETARSWYTYLINTWPDSRQAMDAQSRLRRL